MDQLYDTEPGQPRVPLRATPEGYLLVQIAGGGSSVTNLTTTVSPTNVVVASDTGSDATIPLADVTNAGVMPPAAVTQLAGLGTASEADVGDFAAADHTHALLMTADERTKLGALPAAADLTTSLAGKMANTLPAMQTAFNGGTAPEKAAFQSSVSGDAVGPLGRKLIAAYARVSGQNVHDLGVMASPPSVSNVQTDPAPKRQTGFWATNGRSQFKLRGITSDAFIVQYFTNFLRVNSCRTAAATYQNATSGFTVEFVTDAPSFSIELNSAGTDPVWIAVGNPSMTGMQMTAVDGHTTSYALTIDWSGVRKMRGYRFYMSQAHGFGRVNIGASDTLYRPRYYEPRILDMGDSITALALSPASGGPIYGYTAAVREISGCDVVGHGIAGSGYLTGNVATNQYRIDDAALAGADLIRLNFGINDNGQSAAAVQAACTVVLNGLRALMPVTPIEVKGPFGGNTNASAAMLAIEAGISAAVAAINDSRVAFTPALTASDDNWPELLGTTDTDTSAGVAGNSGIMTGNDGTHPSRDGGKYLARRRHESTISTVIRMGW